MPKKRPIKKHSVRANLSVKELTKAGSSLDLEIYANKEKIGTLILGRGSLFWFWQETTHSKTNSMESICRDDG